MPHQTQTPVSWDLTTILNFADYCGRFGRSLHKTPAERGCSENSNKLLHEYCREGCMILHEFCQVQENITSFFSKQYNINPFFVRKSANKNYIGNFQFFSNGYFVTAFSLLSVSLKDKKSNLSFCIMLANHFFLTATLLTAIFNVNWFSWCQH